LSFYLPNSNELENTVCRGQASTAHGGTSAIGTSAELPPRSCELGGGSAYTRIGTTSYCGDAHLKDRRAREVSQVGIFLTAGVDASLTVL
jgi:hypothetical protein